MLQDDFFRLRCAGTPWCLLLTPDYREAIRSIAKHLAAKPKPPSIWTWDFLMGHQCVSNVADTEILGGPDDTVNAPALLLKSALKLPANSVLFFIVPKQDMVDDLGVIQGIANLRNEFKANQRTLVILARDVKLPAFLAEDIPVLDDPLPDDKELRRIAESLLKSCNLVVNGKPDVETAADLCRGMTSFATRCDGEERLAAAGIHPLQRKETACRLKPFLNCPTRRRP